MLLGLTGDWHQGCTIHSSVDEETKMPTRVLDIEAGIRQVFEKCIEHGAERVVAAGDLYHVDDPPTTYVARSIDLIRSLGRSARAAMPAFEMHAFDGNHDFNGKPGKRNASAPLAEALKDEPWFRWYPKRQTVEEFAPGARALFIPHGTKVREDAFPDDAKANLVFCHTTIQGAVSGAEETLLADKVRDLGPIHGRVDMYLSGHIHKPQEFSYQGALVIYPGSLERIDFGERDEQKSFVLIDLSKVVVERERSYRRIVLRTRPMVQIDLVLSAGWTAQAHPWPDVKDAIVKVVVHAHERDLSAFRASEVRDLLVARGANYVCGFGMDIEREREVRDPEMTERLTPADALRRYVEKNLPHKTADQQATVRAILDEGSRILAEAQ